MEMKSQRRTTPLGTTATTQRGDPRPDLIRVRAHRFPGEGKVMRIGSINVGTMTRKSRIRGFDATEKDGNSLRTGNEMEKHEQQVPIFEHEDESIQILLPWNREHPKRSWNRRF